MTRRSVRAGLLLGAAAALVLASTTGPVDAEEPSVSASAADSFAFQSWTTAFAAGQARQLPAGSIDFAGHPLDVTFDSAGRVWGIGEFSLQTPWVSGTTVNREALPMKVYVDAAGQLRDWSKPFRDWQGNLSAGSSLGESVIRAGSTVWAAYGGSQGSALTDNHSILVRYDSTTATASNPGWAASCAIPLPGDNNEVIGLAYDATRGRVWFVESEGDNRVGGGVAPYATVGWVKVAGLGSRCQNTLDYGGDSTRSIAWNQARRDEAQATMDGLQCTAAQDSNAAANCVHIVAGTDLGSGAAHVAYDAGAGALWITNWYDSSLWKFSIANETFTRHAAPAPPEDLPDGELATAWQIAVNGTHVYVNEYEGSRILRFTKATGAWSVVDIPSDGWQREVHSIALEGSKLWFTLSDENYNSQTAIGYVDLTAWSSAQKGTIYQGWGSLPMLAANQSAGNRHSFRGIEVNPAGTRIALADHGDLAYVTLTKK